MTAPPAVDDVVEAWRFRSMVRTAGTSGRRAACDLVVTPHACRCHCRGAIVAGVAIRLYYADHEPAHFHAVAGGAEMLVRIADLTVMTGQLPPNQRQAVLAWARDHQDSLALAWLRARQGQKPGKIG